MEGNRLKITITDDPNWGDVRYHVEVDHDGITSSGIAKGLEESFIVAHHLSGRNRYTDEELDAMCDYAETTTGH